MFTTIVAQTMINELPISKLAHMTEASKILIDQALELTAAERAVVAEQILLSLGRPDPNIDGIWVSETEARFDAYDQGRLVSIPAKVVFGKYKAE